MSFISVLDLGMSGDISQDATALFQAAINTVPEGSTIYVPEGKVVSIGNPQVPLGDAVIRVSRRVHLAGPGRIHDPDPGHDFAAGRSNSYGLIMVEAPGVTIKGLTFTGTNDPFGGINNFIIETQFCIFFTGPPFGHSDGGSVENCTFRNLWGHTVKSFDNERIHVRKCVFYECTNGVNINSSYSEQTGNTMTRCNGFETIGSYNLIADNVLLESSGISIGGRGDGVPVIGTIVARNKITKTRKGSGITCAAPADCTIEDNEIIDASWDQPGFQGLVVYNSTAANVPGWIEGVAGKNYIRRNKIRMFPGGASHGMWIRTGAGTVIEDNDVGEGPHAHFGIVLQAHDCILRRNKFEGGAGDILLNPFPNEALTVYLQGNTGDILTSIPGGSSVTQLVAPTFSSMTKISLGDVLSGLSSDNATDTLRSLMDFMSHDALVEVPQGKTFRITSGINIPVRMKLWGGGTILVDDVGVIQSGSVVGAFSALHVLSGGMGTVDAPGTKINGIKFVGKNSPFGGVVTNVSQTRAAIEVTATGVEINNCEFSNLYSDVVRSPAGHNFFGVSVRDCIITDCAGAVRVHADDSVILRNRITRADGIFCSGDRSEITDNVLELNLQGRGIQAGGKLGADEIVATGVSSFVTTGLKVLRNVINQSSLYGIAILGVTDAEISENQITNAGRDGDAGIRVQNFDGGSTLQVSKNLVLKKNLVTMHVDSLAHAMWMERGAGSIIHENNLLSRVLGCVVQVSDLDLYKNIIQGPAAALFLNRVGSEILTIRLSDNLLTADDVAVLVVQGTPCKIFNYGSR